MGLPQGVIVGRPRETAQGFQRFGHDVKRAADVADRAMVAIHETLWSLQ
jgi:hypothetical protein